MANYENTPSFGNGDLEHLDLIAFDHTTTGVEEGFPNAGADTGIGFSSDNIVARAVNFFPCFELHFEPGEFEGPGHEILLGRRNLTSHVFTYGAQVPGVYLSNSSDFPWEPGSTLYLLHDGFNPTNLFTNQEYPAYFDPELPVTRLSEAQPELVYSDGNDTWTVEPVYWEDKLMGYKFTLTRGRWDVFESIQVDGMRLDTDADFRWNPLKLNAWAFFEAQGVKGPNDLGNLGPIRKTVAEMDAGEDGYRNALLYTAYDRPDWNFKVHIVNPWPKPVSVNGILYHLSGLTLAVLGEEVPPSAKSP